MKSSPVVLIVCRLDINLSSCEQQTWLLPKYMYIVVTYSIMMYNKWANISLFTLLQSTCNFLGWCWCCFCAVLIYLICVLVHVYESVACDCIILFITKVNKYVWSLHCELEQRLFQFVFIELDQSKHKWLEITDFLLFSIETHQLFNATAFIIYNHNTLKVI